MRTLPLLLIGLIGPTQAPNDPRVAEIVNTVEGQTTILKLVPEGEKVRQGQVIAELDSARLRDRLIDQKIAEAQAIADLENCKKAVEVATVNAQESEEATLDEINTTKNEAKVAELDIKIAEEKIGDAKKKLRINNDRSEYDKAVSDLDRAKQNLNRAQARLKNLETFVKQRRKAEADLEISKAKTNLKSSESIAKIETGRREKLEKMIAACTVKAPRAGRLRYANPDPPRPDGYVIEEGALVRERQVFLRVLAD